ncbi:MAG: carbamoyltransferase HypF [Pseudomonadota bacterium]
MSRVANQTAVQQEQVRVRGIVQGVGFRPTVWRIANDIGLVGATLNDADGVLVSVWGTANQIDYFCARLREECPPLARIDTIERSLGDALGVAPTSFEIQHSKDGVMKTSIAADASTCAKCVKDVLDPFSRRYRYPFANCTDCGPRFSIIRGAPYDRSQTSMASFEMCAECDDEYQDPANRRFHTQPNACHACGPAAKLIRADGRVLCTESLTQLDDVDAACSLIQSGEIVAIKGIGGFHLACDATNASAVEQLRQRKQRFAKPFALMAANIEIVREYCHVGPEEVSLLESPAAPIVVLERLASNPLPAMVAPGQSTIGFMLPYTPLHHLLLKRMRRPIVLTSGNVSDEPQCIDNDDATSRLAALCDYLLVHDREIVNRVDDSVVRVTSGKARLLRRARGYAPSSIPLPKGFECAPQAIALGADLKNTFCVIKEGSAVLSQHIGDLHDARTLTDFEKNLELYDALYERDGSYIFVDEHPEYMSTKVGKAIAADQDLALLPVQHHHAHIAACLGDNAWSLDAGKVLGVALDGLGLGNDGTWWGGEFLLADYTSAERLATFKPVPLLGNAQAMQEPWRNTYAHIMAQMGWTAFKMNFSQLELCRFLESKPLDTLQAMIKSATNAPLATSCGRLFDAAAAAMRICRDRVSYEGQAAIEMEALVCRDTLETEADNLAYPFTLPRLDKAGLPYIEPLAMWNALFGDLVLQTPTSVMAARFHKGLAKAIVHTVRVAGSRDGERLTNTVALSGGVFQNTVLFDQVVSRLEAENYAVLTHSQIPSNDGGLSFGQALIGSAKLINGDTNACA